MTLEDKKTYEKIVEEQKWCQLCGRAYDLHIHHIIIEAN